MAPALSAGATPQVGGVAWFFAEELGDDLSVLLGTHTDTISMLSPALLQRPNGHDDLRNFLRHLRCLLDGRPQRLAALRARAEKAAQATQRDAEAQVSAERRAADNKDAMLAFESQTDVTATRLRHELTEAWEAVAAARAAWAQERAELLGELSRDDAAAKEAEQVGAAEWALMRDGWNRDAAGGRAQLQAQGTLLQTRAAELQKRQAELAWVWELIGEQKTAISGLSLMLQCSEDANVRARQDAERNFIESAVGKNILLQSGFAGGT